MMGVAFFEPFFNRLFQKVNFSKYYDLYRRNASGTELKHACKNLFQMANIEYKNVATK